MGWQASKMGCSHRREPLLGYRASCYFPSCLVVEMWPLVWSWGWWRGWSGGGRHSYAHCMIQALWGGCIQVMIFEGGQVALIASWWGHRNNCFSICLVIVAEKGKIWDKLEGFRSSSGGISEESTRVKDMMLKGEKKISTYWWLVSCGSCPLGIWRFVSFCRGWPTFQKWLWNLACLRETSFLARATGWLIWLGYSWLLLRYQESSRAGY